LLKNSLTIKSINYIFFSGTKPIKIHVFLFG